MVCQESAQEERTTVANIVAEPTLGVETNVAVVAGNGTTGFALKRVVMH